MYLKKSRNRYKKRGKRGVKVFLIAFFLMFFWVIGIYLYTTYQKIDINTNYEVQKVESTKNVQTVESVQEESTNIADMIEQVTESIVGISKLKNAGGSIFTKSSEDELGLGTGIIVSEKGYILSNQHVTGDKLSTCYITLENGSNYTGTVMWADSNLDLSITKIDAKNLKKVKLGNSDTVRAGENIYAIGNPIGFEFRRTVTSGIISATNRTIKLEEEEDLAYMTNLIQTDATINPGNSGGPLILPNGEVIGINTVKITTAEGIGFAVPINVVKPVIQRFEQNDTFEEAIIGIYAYDKEVIPYLSANATSFDRGIYVVQITPNGPASETELQEGDIINSIDNVMLETMNDLRQYIYTKAPGDVVTLAITRGKITRQIVIVLG